MNRKLLEAYFPKIMLEVKGYAIFMMDVNGTILTWNFGCELMKQYKEAEAIGQNYRILFPDFLIADLLHQSALKFKAIINDMGTTAANEAEDYAYISFQDIMKEIKLLLAQEIQEKNIHIKEDILESTSAVCFKI